MAKQPKGGKINVYFREFDKEFYNKIMEEANDANQTASQTLLGYARLGFGRAFNENEMLCEKCGSTLS